MASKTFHTYILTNSPEAALRSAASGNYDESTIKTLPFEEFCHVHLTIVIVRGCDAPLVTGAIPGVAVIIGSAPTGEETTLLSFKAVSPSD